MKKSLKRDVQSLLESRYIKASEEYRKACVLMQHVIMFTSIKMLNMDANR